MISRPLSEGIFVEYRSADGLQDFTGSTQRSRRNDQQGNDEPEGTCHGLTCGSVLRPASVGMRQLVFIHSASCRALLTKSPWPEWKVFVFFRDSLSPSGPITIDDSTLQTFSWKSHV